MPVIVQGTGDRTKNKMDENPCLHDVHMMDRAKINHDLKYRVCQMVTSGKD